LLAENPAEAYALVAVDHYSRFAGLEFMEQATTANTTRALGRLSRQMGKFDTLLSDPGPQFSSWQFQRYRRRKKMKHHFGSVRNYHSTGVVERLARTLKTIAAKFQPASNVNSADLMDAVIAYNKTPHKALGVSPFEAFTGCPPRLEIDQVIQPFRRYTPPADHRARHVASRTKTANKGRPALKRDDTVRFYPPCSTRDRHAAGRHLKPKSTGPFRIIKPLPHNRFLCFLCHHGTTHILPAAQLFKVSLF
jgi:hypothetical protein